MNKYEPKQFEYEKWKEYPQTSSSCAHESCSRCHGTGRKESGEMCVHLIYCSCPKCNTYFIN